MIRLTPQSKISWVMRSEREPHDFGFAILDFGFEFTIQNSKSKIELGRRRGKVER
jgi:hypothetical protein